MLHSILALVRQAAEEPQWVQIALAVVTVVAGFASRYLYEGFQSVLGVVNKEVPKWLHRAVFTFMVEALNIGAVATGHPIFPGIDTVNEAGLTGLVVALIGMGIHELAKKKTASVVP